MVAVLGPYEALPYYIHTYIHKPSRLQEELSSCWFVAWLLLFDPEERGSMFLRNVCRVAPD
jgi:hypothetical protein